MSFHPLHGVRETAPRRPTHGVRAGICLVFALGLADAALAQGAEPAATPAPPADVVASVNGQPISSAELQIMTGQILAVTKPTRRSDITDAEHAARERLIRLVALAQEATRLGIDRDPAVQAVLAYQNTTSLANAYLKQQLRQNPVTDAMVEEEYRRGMIAGKPGEYHLRHIIVADEGRARDALAALKKGDDFGSVAKLLSGDPKVASTGGDLGWLRLDNLEDSHFVDAVLKLKPGHYSPEPVLSSSGWHVIQLVEKPRAGDAGTPFAELPATSRDKIRRRATQRALDKLETEAYDKATITRAELRTLDAAE
jgi:peptidyl-prolyl cis-trans isomerase C